MREISEEEQVRLLAEAKHEAEALGYSVDEYISLKVKKCEEPPTRADLMILLTRMRSIMIGMQIALYQVAMDKKEEFSLKMNEISALGDEVDSQIDALCAVDPKP